MAGDQNQSDLRAVVENLVSHPGFRRIVSDAVQQSSQCNERNVNVSANATSSPNSRTTFTSATSPPNMSRTTFTSATSPQEELRSLFRRGGQGRGGGTVASFVPVLGSNRSNARSSRSRRGGKVQRKKFSREVVLLSKANDKFVVRGRSKADLMRKGHVIQCFDFFKEWTKEEVLESLTDAFAEALQGTRFQIMLGVGNDLVAPKLAQGQVFDGEKISKLFTQKTIWLLPEKDLLSDISQHTLTDALNSTASVQYPATSADDPTTSTHDYTTSADDPTTSTYDPTTSAQHPTASVQYHATSADDPTTSFQHPTPSAQHPTTTFQHPTTSFQQPTTSSQHPSTSHYPVTMDGCKIQLQEMFPDRELSAIERAIASSSDLDEAISKLLDESDESSDDDIWTSPLAATKKLKLNPMDDLKCFIRQIKKCQSEEQFFITREKSFVSQVIGKYKNPTFDLGCKLSVEFRSFGTDELGVDAGGPSKEFFNELMKELQTGGYKGIRFFEGEKSHYTPMY